MARSLVSGGGGIRELQEKVTERLGIPPTP